jgi:5-methylcytosine-specific restriction endonuclease McrA
MRHTNTEEGKTFLFTTKQVECSICGNLFTKRTGDYNRSVKLGKKIYCSDACESIGRNKKKSIPCENCGILVIRPISEIKKHVYCSKECAETDSGYHLSNNNHPRWKGGGKYLRGKGWKKSRKMCRIRDKYTCMHCGMTEKELGKQMDVHHVIPYRLFNTDDEANSISNLICLCPSCHHREDARIGY